MSSVSPTDLRNKICCRSSIEGKWNFRSGRTL